MGLTPDTLTFDTGDPVRVATFWAAALGYDLVDPDPEGVYIADPSGQTRGIFFQTRGAMMSFVGSASTRRSATSHR